MAGNALRRTVTDYGPDPAESWVRSLVRDTVTRVQGALVAAVHGADDDPSTTYGGALPHPLQHFAGVDGYTANVIRNGGWAELSSGMSEGPMADPARRIFADRLRRRQSTGGE